MQQQMQNLQTLEAELLDLEVETFEIEDIADLEQHAAESTCSSTTSSTCSSGGGGGGGRRED